MSTPGYLQNSIARLPRIPTSSGRLRLVGTRLLSGSISYLFLLLFIVVIYTSPGEIFKWLKGPALIVAGITLIFLIAQKVQKRELIVAVWPCSYLLLGFAWVSGLSCFDAAWPHLSFESTMDLIKFTIVYFLIVNIVDSPTRLQGILLTMVAGGLVPSLGTLNNYRVGNIHPGERVHWVGVFANSNDLAYSLVLLIPFAATFAFEWKWLGRYAMFAVMFAYTAAIYVSFSRGGFLGLIVVLLLIGIRHKSTFVRLSTLALIAGSVFFAAYFWSRAEGFTNLSDFTLQQRLITIRTGIAMFIDRPLLGVGLGGSLAAFPQYAPPDLHFTESLMTHNTFIQALSEVGIIGFTIFTLLIVTAFTSTRRSFRMAIAKDQRRTANLIRAIEVSLWGFLVCGLFGPYVLSWFPYILIGLVSAAEKIVSKIPETKKRTIVAAATSDGRLVSVADARATTGWKPATGV